jgi:hypothetical protein
VRLSQELLAHPFLHPSKASPPPEPASQPVAGFTKDHLKMMLSAMVAASGGGGSVDVDHLAEAVFQKVCVILYSAQNFLVMFNP